MKRLLILFLILQSTALAHEIDLSRIAQLESSGGKFLVGDCGKSLGKFQIQSALVSDYNRVEKEGVFHRELLFNEELSERIVNWAFGKYFPIILRQLKKPVTTENLLVCWNAGCGALRRERLPKVTQDYLIKYEKLSKEQRT